MHNYQQLQFKSGLEIHQQLEGKKLFCDCPTIIKDGTPDFKIRRRLRASASELGEIDQAALHELKKEKEFIYEGYKEANCLIDIDEEPPKKMNKKALETTLKLALLLKAKPLDYIQFMRKIVIDGSNTAAFQRTALIAVNGEIETSRGNVKIESVCLEEESAKKVNDTETERRYNISRLGIPLIEIATDASLQDPEHVKEAAVKIGMILRSLEGIKRGIGSIRQDVNISIKNGARIEIKGFQDYRNIPKVIDNEITRQLQEKKKQEAHVRSARPDFSTQYERPMPGAARMYVETDIPLHKIAKDYLKTLHLPELLEEQMLRLEETFKIDNTQAKDLLKENLEEYFKKASLLCSNLKNTYIAELILNLPKEFKKNHNKTIHHDDFFLSILEHLDKRNIAKESLEKIFLDKVNNKPFNIKNYGLKDMKELEEEIKILIKEKPELNFQALMGELMKKNRGKIDGKTAAELIKKHSIFS